MNELQLIQSKIHEIRGQKVMLDRDLAQMYGVETRVLNQAVKRNADRFPIDFMFRLSKEEWENLKSQSVTSNWGGVRKMPYAFTELGVAMLSSVLTSRIAIQINIGIMRAFVAVRQMLSEDSSMKRLSALEKNFEELKQDLEDIFADYNDINEDTRAQLEAINTTLAELQSRPPITPRRPVGFIKPDSR
ncbi:MAG: ORF6N domain-containing protein [Lachnospiraceae bacterium]|nr:ORF6N domain-containing protein [Lachnospiraceae bacterium]